MENNEIFMKNLNSDEKIILTKKIILKKNNSDENKNNSD